MTGQELHDRLRAELPEDAACVSDCPFCAEKPEVASRQEENVSDKVYDQESVDALLSNARDKAAEEARVDADRQIAELEATLKEKDEALAAANAKVEELEGEIKAAAEAARLAELADERASQVMEVTEFSEEHVAERKEAWARMSDDEFASVLKDFEEITESASRHDDGKPPKSPKLDPVRETAGKKGSDINRLRDYLSVSGI